MNSFRVWSQINNLTLILFYKIDDIIPSPSINVNLSCFTIDNVITFCFFIKPKILTFSFLQFPSKPRLSIHVRSRCIPITLVFHRATRIPAHRYISHEKLLKLIKRWWQYYKTLFPFLHSHILIIYQNLKLQGRETRNSFLTSFSTVTLSISITHQSRPCVCSLLLNLPFYQYLPPAKPIQTISPRHTKRCSEAKWSEV